MGQIKGALEYRKWEQGVELTRKEAMLAHCYSCNGFEDSKANCKGSLKCPMYEFFSYRGKG